MKNVCQYAVIRYLPDIDRGEFANVGIVLYCPKTGYFGFETNKSADRISAFFSTQTGKIYLKGIQDVIAELKRVQNLIKQRWYEDKEQAEALFKELVREREGIFQYSEPGLVLTDSPEEKINQLFALYVEKRTMQDWALEQASSQTPVLA